jgi:predicted DCC family thiol-disulfide oxidoreductase YuxK
LEQVRERLHVKAEDGQLDIGADAFTHLWLQTPGLRWLAKLLQLPILRQITHLVYNAFARLLYRWNRAKGHW